MCADQGIFIRLVRHHFHSGEFLHRPVRIRYSVSETKKCMNIRFVSSVLAGSALLFLLSSCTTDPVFEERSVAVSISALPELDPADGHYELWFSYPDDGTGKPAGTSHGDAAFISMGTFTVDAEGNPVSLSGGPAEFAIPEGYNANLLIDAILTLEPQSGSLGEPGPRLLAGAFQGSSSQANAALTLSGQDAFGRGLDTINLQGTVRLATPSTESSDDEAQGIWFIDAVDASSLALRAHPINLENTGWIYQAWLVKNGTGARQYVSLGMFDDPAEQDATGPGPNAGTNPVSWTAPGEDFVQGNVLTLNDGTWGVVVSLQPRDLLLDFPFFPLLSAGTIPDGFGTLSTDLLTLERFTEQPVIEIIVER